MILAYYSVINENFRGLFVEQIQHPDIIDAIEKLPGPDPGR
mgnify:CR=1 FL=1